MLSPSRVTLSSSFREFLLDYQGHWLFLEIRRWDAYFAHHSCSLFTWSQEHSCWVNVKDHFKVGKKGWEDSLCFRKEGLLLSSPSGTLVISENYMKLLEREREMLE